MNEAVVKSEVCYCPVCDILLSLPLGEEKCPTCGSSVYRYDESEIEED